MESIRVGVEAAVALCDGFLFAYLVAAVGDQERGTVRSALLRFGHRKAKALGGIDVGYSCRDTRINRLGQGSGLRGWLQGTGTGTGTSTGRQPVTLGCTTQHPSDSNDEGRSNSSSSSGRFSLSLSLLFSRPGSCNG